MPDPNAASLISESVLVGAMDALAAPPSAPTQEETPSVTPPVEAEGQADAGQTPSGDVEQTTEPNPPQGEEAAAPELHPVLQTLPEDMREGLKGLTPEQQENVAKIRGLYETEFQHDHQAQADLERDAKAFREIVPNTPEGKALRETLWRLKREQEQGKSLEPQPLKRPRAEDFDTQAEYDTAMDTYEEARDARTLAKVQETLTAPQRKQQEIEKGLWQHRLTMGKAVTDEQYVAAVKAFDSMLAKPENAEMVRDLTVAGARLAVQSILDAKASRAPVVNPPQPNPQPRAMKPASVPARGVPPRVPPKERWEAEGRSTPTAEEAWDASGRDTAALGTTRAPSTNGSR